MQRNLEWPHVTQFDVSIIWEQTNKQTNQSVDEVIGFCAILQISDVVVILECQLVLEGLNLFLYVNV